MREVSYSQLGCARRCRFRWGLRYLLRLSRKIPSAGLGFGKFFHESLGSYYKEVYPTGEFGKEAQDRFWANQLVGTEEGMEWVDLDYARLFLGRYHSRYWETDSVTDGHRVVEVEFGFRVPVPDLEGKDSDYHLIGFVDLITVDQKGWWWIWDHKTGKSFPQRLSLTMDSQLSTYSWAISRMRGKSVDGVILNLLKKTKKPEYNRVLAIKTQEEVDRWQKVLYVDCATLPPEDSDWRLLQRNPNPECSWDCEYLDLCRLDVEGEINAFQDLLSMEYTSGSRAPLAEKLKEHAPTSWGVI